MKQFSADRNREMPVEYYNEKIPKDLPPAWFTMYMIAVSLAIEQDKNNKIMDIGCGPGRIAEVLQFIGIPRHQYWGFDWAEKCIELAVKNYPKYIFGIGNFYNKEVHKLYKDFDAFLILECLEHVEDDFGVIKPIPSGKIVIISVPNTWDESHVRIFRSHHEVMARYSGLIHINFASSLLVHNGGKLFHIIRGIRL